MGNGGGSGRGEGVSSGQMSGMSRRQNQRDALRVWWQGVRGEESRMAPGGGFGLSKRKDRVLFTEIRSVRKKWIGEENQEFGFEQA